jgi:hypothetical protein
MLNETQKAAFDQWEGYVLDKKTELLEPLLADEVVFHSPVVWTPQTGKALTALYLRAATVVLKDFSYTRQIIAGNHWCLEFSGKIGDVSVKGVDLIQINEAGKIIDFEVMVRPLKAVNAIHEAMGAMLEQMKSSVKPVS